jgi:hypothetical protein
MAIRANRRTVFGLVGSERQPSAQRVAETVGLSRRVVIPQREGTRTVVDEFRLGGDLTMDLDADQVFGPMVVLVTMLSDPSVMKDLPVGE